MAIVEQCLACPKFKFQLLCNLRLQFVYCLLNLRCGSVGRIGQGRSPFLKYHLFTCHLYSLFLYSVFLSSISCLQLKCSCSTEVHTFILVTLSIQTTLQVLSIVGGVCMWLSEASNLSPLDCSECTWSCKMTSVSLGMTEVNSVYYI